MLFSIECQCEGSPLSPGQPGCVPIVGRDKFPIFFEYTDSTGALNGIPAGTVLNEAFLIGKLNQTDLTKKWYVFPEMFNIAAPPAENETEDVEGTPVPTGEEIKQTVTFEHVKKDANPALKASYDSIKCEDLGMLTGTYSGQISGMGDGLGNLVGTHIKSGTLSAQYGQPVKGTLQKMMVSFIVDDLENDANRDYIASSSIAFPVKKWFTKQPLEIIPLEISSAVAAATFTLNGLYGLANFKSPIAGILTVDISPDLGTTTGEAYNVTTAANVAGTLAESGTTPGQYVFTYTAPIASSDVVHVDVFKSGYHMATLVLTAAI
tara:strand:- start:2204 stop:3166 length:963 start_codon:yes stop_codon:yes gene_type:complete